MTWESAIKRVKVSQRERDMVIVERVNEREEDLTDHEQIAFENMAEWLAGSPHRELSEKQRSWSLDVLDRLGVDPPDEYEVTSPTARVPASQDGPSKPLDESIFGPKVLDRPPVKR